MTLFGFDPNYRGFTGGIQQMLLNAITGPAPSASVSAHARVTQAEPSVAASDRLVISVKQKAAKQVQALLDAQGAAADVVRARGVVSYRVDLGGLTSDEHPWAQDLAQQAAGLGPDVVAVRLP